jgi:hypothetical protein
VDKLSLRFVFGVLDENRGLKNLVKRNGFKLMAG